MQAQNVVYWKAEEECLPRQELEKLQLERLRQQLAHVSERSPMYKRKLSAAGISPSDIRSIDDVSCIPFTEKSELKESQQVHLPWGDFACITPNEAVRVFQTSGSTGLPMRIMLNGKDWFENYYDQFSHFRCSYGLTNNDILFVPFSYALYIAWWGFQAAMESAGLMIVPGGGQSSKDRLRNIENWGATVVCGTPSYLLYLAETARKMGIDLPGSSVRKLVAAGEPGASVPATKKAIEEQWGAECFDDIGSTESSNFGYSCVAHSGTHVIEGHFLAEVLDPKTLEPLPDGEIGELVLTNLKCESTPLIRYRTGDLVKFNREKCSCGRSNLRLEGGILGRADDMFQHAGVNVYPGQIQNLLHESEEFSQEYQLVVPPIGSGKHLCIRVEPANEKVSDAVLKQAVEKLIDNIKYRITITPDIQVVGIGELPRVEGKARRVIRDS